MFETGSSAKMFAEKITVSIMIYRFGSFELDTDTRELRSAGRMLAIQPKPLSLLVYLIENKDRMVPKSELLDVFWSATVSEAALQTAISIARKAVATANDSPVIKTYHGRGFRFVAELACAEQVPSNETLKTVASPLERRLVTVLSVRLLENAGTSSAADDRQEAIDRFFSTAREKVASDLGRLIHIMPDGFTAVFGLDPPSEDGARLATFCACELSDAAATRDIGALGIAVAFGLDSGPVAFANGDDSAEWAPPGAVERSAANIALGAGGNEILLSDKTYSQLRDEIQARRCEKGYLLQARPDRRAGVPARPLRRTSRFVGRRTEMSFLTASLSEAANGAGQAATLSGPPGIGKSRLLGEFMTGLDRQGYRYLLASCFPRLMDTPLAPVRQLCRELSSLVPENIVEDDIEEALLARILDEAPATAPALEGLSESILRQRSHDLFKRLLETACEAGPLVVIVEDLHWVDRDSRGYLDSTIRWLGNKSLLLVLTTRPTIDETALTDAALSLSPLSRNDCLELLQDVAEGANIQKADADALIRRAAGNPFFLEELAFSARSSNDPAGDIPDTVQAVVEVRIAKLSPGQRAQLYAIAVIGSPAPEVQTAQLLGTTIEALEPDFAQLVKMGFLQEDPDGFSFRHILLQEAAYAMIEPSDRKRMHGDLARLLAEPPYEVRSETLAWHAQEAGEIDRAIGYWSKASNAALYRSEGMAAITFAKKGLALIDPSLSGTNAAELPLQLALAAGLMKQRGYAADEVGLAYDRAHRLSISVGSVKARVRAVLGLWVHTWVAGRLNESLSHGRELLELAEQIDDPALRLHGHGGIGSVLMHKGELDAAMEHLTAGCRFIDECDTSTITHQHAALTCTSYAAWTCALQGNLSEMQSLHTQAEALCQAIENPFAMAIQLSLRASAIICTEDVAACEDLAMRAVALSREQKFPFWLGTSLVVWGWAVGQREDFTTAFKAIDEGIEVFEATKAGVQLANWYGLKAETFLAAGRPEEGLRAARHALACAERTGDVWFVPRIHVTSARLQERLGNVERAAWHQSQADLLVERCRLSRSFVTMPIH